jgi:hypothetical protein
MRRAGGPLAVLAALVSVALVSSCSNATTDDVFSLADQPEALTAVYRFVAANPELLEQVVCYCGCGDTLAHRHLRDCFYTDNGRPDPHAAGCGVCLAEAIEVERMLAAGMGDQAIVDAIDERFGQMGPPTQAR